MRKKLLLYFARTVLLASLLIDMGMIVNFLCDGYILLPVLTAFIGAQCITSIETLNKQLEKL